MHELLHFSQGLSRQQQGTKHLDATTSGTGCADDAREKQHPDGREDGPHIVILGREAGSGGDRDDIEGAVSQRFQYIWIDAFDDQQSGDGDDAERQD